MNSNGTSLVLVTVDCLRADHTGFMGYQRPTTPFLDQLAGESMVFPNAIATGAPTYYSFPGILASRFALRLGRDVVGIAPGERSLASILQQSGYGTAGFVAANPYLSSRFGYDQGFEVFRDFLSVELGGEDQAQTNPEVRGRTQINRQLSNLAHKIGPLGRLYDELYFQYCVRAATPKSQNWDTLRRFPPADVLVDAAREWLRSVGAGPFFLWIHFMDPHAPYYPAAKALEAMDDEDITPTRARYLNAFWNRGDLAAQRLRKHRDEIIRLHDAGIRWVDAQLAALVEELQRLSLWDSTALVLTADHGEEFLDHGGRFHPPSNPSQEMLHVPLLVRFPGLSKKPLSDSPFSQLHLAPTILEGLGIEAPPEFEGCSYWSQLQAGEGWESAVSESIAGCTNPMDAGKREGARILVLQDRRYKLVLDFESGTDKLFDLGRDPQERRPLAPDVEKRARVRLLQAARQHLDRRPAGDLTLRARVRQLGLEWNHSKFQSQTLAS